MADFFNSNPRTMALMRALGLLPSGLVQAPVQTPSPFSVPYTGLRNAPTDAATFLPPFEQPGTVASKYMPPLAPPTMPPVTVKATPPPAAPPVTVTAPAPVDISQMPMGVGGEAMPPNGADPDHPASGAVQPPQPDAGALQEIFRREYAANPRGFTPGRLFGLLG